ncbi:hypothetical protein [Intestinibacter sp.]|uniref:hypothetical protein n=1 Tax=Intestinibacter sp. TaxID=1965304 RepID=UPI003F164D48
MEPIEIISRHMPKNTTQQDKYNEYMMLREEIMVIIKSYYDNIRNMVAIYPLVAGFAWNIDNAFVQFVPMVFVLVTYLVNQANWLANCKLSAYMTVALNECKISWEQHNALYNNRKFGRIGKKFDIFGISPHYYITLLMCYIMSLYKNYLLNYNVIHRSEDVFYGNVIISTVIAAVIFTAFVYFRHDFESIRYQNIERWERVLSEANDYKRT